MSDPVVLLVTVGLLSVACQLLAYRLRLPAILPLLATGIILGPILGLLDAEQVLGDLLFPLISLSVAIILFEGALTLQFKDIGEHGSMVRNLCTVGVLITCLVAALSSYQILNITWQTALLFGAIVTVSGPTVIGPMLRTMRPSAKLANILRWEGIVIDPIGALLAVLVFEYIVSTQNALSNTLLTFSSAIAVGALIGGAAGWGLGLLLRNRLVPHFLETPCVLVIMLGAFTLSNLLIHESGLLTVTIMGIWLANMRNVNLEDIQEFKQTLSVLLISGLFIVLAARVDIEAIIDLGWGSLVVLAMILFLARPLVVLVSAIGSDLNWREKALISWISPRGIVAAAVSSLFALKLENAGFAEAGLLVPLVFLVIITSVVLQSLTVVQVVKWLGVRSPVPRGFLIFGASAFSRHLAQEFIEQDVPVLLADTDWHAISQARMDNIPSYFGNPSSEHAQRTLDLTGIGRVLVLSPYRQLNPLVTYHFEYLLGKGSAFGLSAHEQEQRASHQLSDAYAKKLGLFARDVSYTQLASLTAKGAEIKTTHLTDSFTLENYFSTYTDKTIPLCAIDPNRRVHLYHSEASLTPGPSWKIISLVPHDVIEQLNRERVRQKIQEKTMQSSVNQTNND